MESFYHLKERLILPGFIINWFTILVAVLALLIYLMINYSKTGQYLSREVNPNVKIADLLAYGNLYDGKKVCTVGYYVSGYQISILKTSLYEERLRNSIWVKTDKEIITRVPGAGSKYIAAQMCGNFNSSRGRNFGEPPTFIHQLTLDSYKTFGDAQIYREKY